MIITLMILFVVSKTGFNHTSTCVYCVGIKREILWPYLLHYYVRKANAEKRANSKKEIDAKNVCIYANKFVTD